MLIVSRLVNLLTWTPASHLEKLIGSERMLVRGLILELMGIKTK
jgi:hypothetical protein